MSGRDHRRERIDFRGQRDVFAQDGHGAGLKDVGWIFCTNSSKR